MWVKDIKIFPCFEKNPPKPEKMEQKERYYLEHGKFESEIAVDGAGNLTDGYSSYLLAVKYGVDFVMIRYCHREVILAEHKAGGPSYTWELPGILIGRVHVGDKVIVETGRGPRRVTVTRVQEYSRQEHEPHRMVIKRCRKGGRAGGYRRVDQIDNQ